MSDATGITGLGLSVVDFMIATRTIYERELDPGGGSDRESRGHQAIVVVVFSALALEGFINELTAIAEFASPDGGSEPPPIVALATTLGGLEKERAGTESKFMLARIALTGQPFDRGSPPYQDFKLLFDVRDAIVHHKPPRWSALPDGQRSEVRARPVLTSLRSKGVLLEGHEDDLESPPFALLSTRAAARWAINAAASMVQSILDVVPPSTCRWILEQGGYAQAFRPLQVNGSLERQGP